MIKKGFWKILFLIFFISILSGLGTLFFIQKIEHKENLFWFKKDLTQNSPSEIKNNQNKKNIEDKKEEKPDWSFIDQVDKVLKEKFVDTREDKSEKITEKKKFYSAVQGYVDAYDDPYTSFFPPEDSQIFLEDISGKFYGVGMEVGNRAGYLMVINPLPGSPAQKAGLKAKDIIYKIDGKLSIKMPVSKAVKLIRGEKGKKVKLTILRKGKDKPFDVEIVRDEIKIPVGLTFVHKGVYVIKIYSFSEKVPSWVIKKIKTELPKAHVNKILLDLRGNPGGLLSSGVFLASLFVEEGKEIIREDFDGKKPANIYKSGDFGPSNIFRNLRLGVLVDEGSASASEIVAGSLMSHKKAILFGTKTFGKGTVQEIHKFKDGSFLKVTIAKFILPDGEWISYKGIEPDVEIKISDEEYKKMAENGVYKKYIDSQLEKAIDEMRKYKTLKDYQKAIDRYYQKRMEKKKKEKTDGLEEAKEFLNTSK